MRPFIFYIGSSPVPSFFFLIAVATLVTTFYYYWLGKRNNLQGAYILDIGMIGMICAVIGARIFHILVEAPVYYWENPIRVFHFWRGGFVSYGGFIGLFLSLVAYLKWRKVNILQYIDALAAASPIIKFFVRLACLFTGCCYGRPTDLPWAITFTDKAATAFHYYPNIPLHPTQIYSMIHATILFIIINLVYQRRKFEGQTMCVLAILWTLPRAVVEAFRADSDRGVYFDGLVSTAQITGVIIAILFTILYFVLKKRAEQQGDLSQT